jgi:hypothetical protein
MIVNIWKKEYLSSINREVSAQQILEVCQWARTLGYLIGIDHSMHQEASRVWHTHTLEQMSYMFKITHVGLFSKTIVLIMFFFGSHLKSIFITCWPYSFHNVTAILYINSSLMASLCQCISVHMHHSKQTISRPFVIVFALWISVCPHTRAVVGRPGCEQ